MPARSRTHFHFTATATFSVSGATVTNGTPVTYTVGVPGARLGDVIDVSLNTPTNNILTDGYVSANGVVTVRLHAVNASQAMAATAAIVQVTRV